MRRVLVTGGSLGIGLATARHLAARGTQLVVVARSASALEAAVAGFDGAGHAWCALDVSDESAWAALDVTELSGLVCAAGVMEPIGPIGSYDVAEFRRTLEINVVGTLLSIEHCLEALRASGGSIVTFGGGGATAPLPRFDAYATSKAAVARLTENLAEVIAPLKINCIAPGFVATRLHEATLAAGPEVAGAAFFERTQNAVAEGGFPPEEAAQLVELLLDDPPFTGKIVSAQWDPWRDEEFQRRLASEHDLATLRRIDDQFFAAKERA